MFSLLHTNIIALSVFFLLLLVGYSYNRTRAGLLAIGVGVLGLLTVIGANSTSRSTAGRARERAADNPRP